MLGSIFSHAEELHAEGTSDFVHQLTSTPVSLAIFVGTLLLLIFVSKKLLKLDTQKTLMFLMPVLFLSGVLLYEQVPVVSALSITIGIGLALVFSLASIVSEE